MIELRTARTLEVDEVEDALDEILAALKPETLKTYSAGIVFSHKEFATSGLIEALHERLDFALIGMTSTPNGDETGFDLYGLSVAVLTSDDVRFAAAITQPLTQQNVEAQINATYKAAREHLGEDPAMSFTFIPHLRDISGAHIVSLYNTACKGSPFWGSICTGVEMFDDNCTTSCNNQVIQDGLAMLLLAGEANPEFIVNSIPDKFISEFRAEVTKSDGYRIYEINNMSSVDYFSSFGLNISRRNLPITTPLLVYFANTSTPVTLGVYNVFDDGSILMGAEVCEGSIVAIGSIHPEGILQTTQQSIQDTVAASSKTGGKGVIFLPCITRYHSLSPNTKAELELLMSEFGKTGIPFLVGYSGGEICPVRNDDGKLENRFHNYTITAVAF